MIDQLLSAAQDGALVITANKRLARDCRAAYDAHQQRAGLRAWPDLPVYPWTVWMRRIAEDAMLAGQAAPSMLLNRPQAEAVWRSIIDESPEGSNLLQLRATVVSAMSAWRLLHQYRIPWKKLHYGGHEDWIAFASWARSFERACAEKRWLDEPRIGNLAAAAISAGVRAPARVLLAGFDELTPEQTFVLKALGERGVTWSPVELEASGEALAERVEAMDPLAELRAAAIWAHDRIVQTPRARIGVVIPDLASIRGTVRRIFTEVFHPDWITGLSTGNALFHISVGRPLSDYPVIHAAFALLRLATGTLPVGEASRLLRSPFVAGAAAEASARARMDARMRRGRQTEVSLAALRRHAKECPILAASLDRWVNVSSPSAQRPAEWARTLAALLAAMGWPGDRPLDSAEYQTLRAWAELLAKFSSLDAVCGESTLGQALERLREIAAGIDFQPEDEGAPVQVMGALEAAGSEFDELWIAGLDADSWPAPARFHPFLPPALQIEYMLPHCTADREYDFARRTLERLFASAPRVMASHARRDGDRELRPSPLIRRLPVGRQAGGSDLWSAWLAKRVILEELADGSAPPFTGETAPGGSRVIQYQSQCPFRAFAELRLGARGFDRPDLGVDPATHGSALHKALQLFWTEMKTQDRLLSAPPAEVEALAGRVSREATDHAVHATHASALERKFHALEAERVERVLLAWLEVEKQRGGFEVEATEQTQKIAAGGLRLDARIDRVDRLEDGSLVVIDYKTKAPKRGSWDGERPDEPQLPLYASALTERVSAVAFAQLTPNSLKFQGVSERAVLPGVKPLAGETMQSKIGEWRRVIERLAGDFRAGDASVDPLKNACQYCPLPALCRVNESGLAQGEDQDAD